MFYKNFIATIKSNGKFFREDGENIHIAFGIEYSLYFKNLESRDAVVKVTIDGEDVLDGNRLIVRANSFTDLEGYMKGQTAKNRFKFIKRIKEIEEYRGIKPEDGLISIQFDFVKNTPGITYTPYWVYQPPYTGTWTTQTNTTHYRSGGKVSSSGLSQTDSSNSTYTSMAYKENAGISVPGNDISQGFHAASIGELENNPATITFKLIGFDQEKNPRQIVFTKDKLKCTSCGLESKSNSKFCNRCGTRLLAY